MSLAGWGTALFAVPQVVLAAAQGHLSSLTMVLVLGLVPVLVVFVVAQKAGGFGAEASPLRMLGPALAGLGGAALVVPFAWPSSGAGMAWLGAVVCAAVLAAVASFQLHGLLAEVGLLRGAAVICAGAGLLAGAFARVGRIAVSDWSTASVSVELARCVFFNGPILLLSVWLLREMRPVSFSSRYLLVPMVTIVEGFLVLRPGGDWTMFAGFALMAAGSAWLLMDDSAEVQTGL